MSKPMTGYFAVVTTDTSDTPTILGPFANHILAMRAVETDEFIAVQIVLGEFTINQTVRLITVPMQGEDK